MTKLQEVEELVVRHAGNGDALPKIEAPSLERVVFAEGLQRPPQELIERYESILDAYTARVKDRIDMEVRKAVAISEQGMTGIELAEPFTGRGYKWWDIFAIGPIQNITLPPFLPHKIIADNELAFFLVFVVKNPLPTPGGGPSALILMNGRRFNLRAHTCNVTACSPGPNLLIRTAFNTAVVQPFLFVFRPPAAQQGRPDLYEINFTADVTEFQQPMAGFATRILDIDNDPDGLPFFLDARKRPHVHDEEPMRFLVYRP